MKFVSLAAAALAFALPAFAQSQSLSYDRTYDDASLSLSDVACSDGIYGLETKGYTTLGSLPNFPNVGGVYTVTGWDSPACGTCYQVTWAETGNSIHILAVDTAPKGFNVAEDAMNTLTEGLAEQLGRIDVTSTRVDVSFCKL